MERQTISHIIKARLCPRMDADYFAVENEKKLHEMVSYLRDDWGHVEYREIVNRDNVLEGILRLCSLGSKARRANLQAYYNAQPEMKGA